MPTPSAAAAAAVDVTAALVVLARLESLLASSNSSDNVSTALQGAPIGAARSSADVSTPLYVGEASVVITGNASSAGSIRVAVVDASSASKLSTTLPGGRATLVSPLAGVSLLDADGELSSAPLPEGLLLEVGLPVVEVPGAPILFNQTWPGCIAAHIFDPEPVAEQTCVAGCCVDRTCECREGYRGELCDLELRCMAIPDGSSTFEDDQICATSETSAGTVVCTCRRLGVVAVLLFQLTPANNNGLRWEDVPELLSSRLTLAAYGPTALMFTVLMVLLLVAAFLADARLRYLSDVSPRVGFLECGLDFSLHRHRLQHCGLVSLGLIPLSLLLYFVCFSLCSGHMRCHGILLFTSLLLLFTLVHLKLSGARNLLSEADRDEQGI